MLMVIESKMLKKIKMLKAVTFLHVLFTFVAFVSYGKKVCKVLDLVELTRVQFFLLQRINISEVNT